MLKRIKVHVTYKNNAWHITYIPKEIPLTPGTFLTQKMAIRDAIDSIYHLLDFNPKAVISLYIHKKKDGKIREERTYPRSRDPKKTKG